MDTQEHADMPKTRVKTYDTPGAADFVGVKVRTLEYWRAKRRGPKFVRYSARCVRYLESDLIEFLAARTVEPGANGSEAR
jgi:hypothetical protein